MQLRTKAKLEHRLSPHRQPAPNANAATGSSRIAAASNLLHLIGMESGRAVSKWCPKTSPQMHTSAKVSPQQAAPRRCQLVTQLTHWMHYSETHQGRLDSKSQDQAVICQVQAAIRAPRRSSSQLSLERHIWQQKQQRQLKPSQGQRQGEGKEQSVRRLLRTRGSGERRRWGHHR